jgi:hypothetical protein
MKRKVLGIWLAVMLFSVASLVTAVASADEVETTNAQFLGPSDIGPDTLKFYDPYQDTTMDFAGPPDRIFKVGDPFILRIWVDTSHTKFTAYYILINLVTKKPLILKYDWQLEKPGKWKLGIGLKDGAPPELKGFDILIAFLTAGSETAKCPKPWWFVVK